jgi:hypothetical protein
VSVSLPAATVSAELRFDALTAAGGDVANVLLWATEPDFIQVRSRTSVSHHSFFVLPRPVCYTFLVARAFAQITIRPHHTRSLTRSHTLISSHTRARTGCDSD